MSDIVERLRDRCRHAAESEDQARERRYKEREEAADTITALRAEVERLRAALEAELADHEEAIAHDGGGLKYASLVGIPVANADSLAQSVSYHERRASLIRAALNTQEPSDDRT